LKFQPRFEATRLGLHTLQFDRCSEAADFLNQILESYPNEGKELSLGYVKNLNEHTEDKLKTKEMEFLHRLRRKKSHGGTTGTSPAEILRLCGSPTDEKMRTWAIEGANQIAAYTGLKSLPRVVEQLLQAQR